MWFLSHHHHHEFLSNSKRRKWGKSWSSEVLWEMLPSFTSFTDTQFSHWSFNMWSFLHVCTVYPENHPPCFMCHLLKAAGEHCPTPAVIGCRYLNLCVLCPVVFINGVRSHPGVLTWQSKSIDEAASHSASSSSNEYLLVRADGWGG